MAGTLYVVATPIGNLGDITARAVQVLESVQHVAAEDTRHSGRLLQHLGLRKPMISLHEHNEQARIDTLADILANGEDIALISDAGTPAVSDPGARLVYALRERSFAVSPIPGPSALTAALSVAGLMEARFVFEGFLPSQGKERKEHLQALAEEPRSIVLYEAPHRLHRTLADLYAVLGERELTVCRELTKIHEQIVRVPLSQAAELWDEPRGEFVLLLEAKPVQEKVIDEEAAREAFRALLAEGMPRKQAAQRIANDFGLSKNAVYGWELPD